ncbi:hypothetical protein P3102_19385 [Amycolatopsis sp. QT-25]|uniref:hypothetical protein n=1 Tax=Amycolatopsis sp. QT-25 TaxID=3034022 RepID=UPI0023EDDB25|nr:hypothetical protein [Amycolatopsis sp. QT-25]WET76297.1 hypothetical protein P3102_19385 [Amycolatopsis sp. QT-25]
MSETRSKSQRVIALAIAVALIIGGIAGVSTAHDVPLATISSAVAILVGLLFLRIATRKS